MLTFSTSCDVRARRRGCRRFAMAVRQESRQHRSATETRSVRSRQAMSKRAMCRVKRKGRQTVLDYTPFATWNDAAGMMPGALRLTFGDPEKITGEWRSPGDHYTRISAVIVRGGELKTLCAAAASTAG
jgi:hypothetical protein